MTETETITITEYMKRRCNVSLSGYERIPEYVKYIEIDEKIRRYPEFQPIYCKMDYESTFKDLLDFIIKEESL